MNERERHRETELTNSHDGCARREGGGSRGGGGRLKNRRKKKKGGGGQNDWKLKFMTLKMTMTETEPGPALLSPLW